MQFTTVAFVFASIVSASASLTARQTNPYPTCAQTCIANADFGGCVPTDTACLCKNQAFITGTTACIEKACTGDDLTTSIAVSQQACAAVGITLSSAPASSPTSSGASSGASSAGSSTGSSTATSPAGGSATSPAPSPTKSSGAALNNNANSLFGIAVAGLVALAL